MLAYGLEYLSVRQLSSALGGSAVLLMSPLNPEHSILLAFQAKHGPCADNTKPHAQNLNLEAL